MKATYKDVKSDILSKITKGEWAPGDLVPNEVELAATYGCARATVNRAMRELADEGLIERRRKAGTRVRMSPVRQARFDIPVVRAEIESRGATYRYSLVSDSVEVAPDWLRARLKLPAEGKAVHLDCMHYADGVPHEHEDRWISLTALPTAEEADFSHAGPTEWLLATIPFSEVEISLSAGLADQRLADYLACAVGEPVFTIERSTWWEGQAVTYVRFSYRPGYRLTTRY
ncbi:UTRA domain-containing protein [Roseovarius arcticus]|uniref:UTRA domain-containing protein n=1 Tax=Roseovarius arcticus TaxID=2547404 RepID=UPI00111023B1|nr:UTRA domain-containing protein [Roseovarius arcticus]